MLQLGNQQRKEWGRLLIRLPISGQDDGVWGKILNAFLEVSHNPDGTLRVSAIPSEFYRKPAGGIPASDLAGNIPGSILTTTVQTQLAQAASAYQKPPTGIPASDLSPSVRSAISGAASAMQSGTAAGGDLTGTYPNPTIAKLQGTTLNGSSPSDGQVLAYSQTASAWVPSTMSGSMINDATTTSKGIVELSGDLGGTASSPIVKSTSLSSALPINQGGTGSATQNFVDLSTSQTVGGAKDFSGGISTTTLQVTGGTPGTGKVLTSDGSGNATWQAASGGSGSSNTHTVITTTTNYPITTSDEIILVDATGGAVTVTLPTAVSNKNQYDIKKIDSSANTVTIATTSSQNIDGAHPAVIKVQYASISVVSDNANWYII